MADSDPDYRSIAWRRMAPDGGIRSPPTAAASNGGSVPRIIQSRALARDWKTSRNEAGQDVIELTLYRYVRSGIRKLKWQSAIGRASPALRNDLAAFLQRDESRSASADDYVEAAYLLARFENGGDVRSSDGPNTAHAADPAALGNARAQYEKLIARRDLLVSRMMALREARRESGGNSAYSEMKLLLTSINSQISGLVTRYDLPKPKLSLAAQQIISETPAALDLVRVIAPVRKHIANVSSMRRLGEAAISAVIKSKAAASRLYLENFKSRGVVLRGNLVRLEQIHPDLLVAVDSLLDRVEDRTPVS